MKPYNKTTHYRVLLISSYCPPDDDECTNSRPCKKCLSMCNTFAVKKDHMGEYLGQLGDGLDDYE